VTRVTDQPPSVICTSPARPLQPPSFPFLGVEADDARALMAPEEICDPRSGSRRVFFREDFESTA
jgi:hypothetical protein